MERIAIVTDSTCDLPGPVLQEQGIHMVPLSVLFGDDEYQDGIDLSPEEFYAKLANATELPTTSQPSAGRFAALFQELETKGVTHVISLHISRKLSGTQNSANIAVKMVPGLKITVVDSRSTSYGLGLLVLYANKLVKDGMGFDEIISRLEAKIPETAIYFAVDSLDSLQRGGRIGKAGAFIGKALGIRPLMVLSGRSGEIEVVKKVRSLEAATSSMVELAQAHVRRYGITLGIAVIHSAVPERMHNLLAVLRADGTDYKRIMTGSIGAVIGAHLGPDGWAVALC